MRLVRKFFRGAAPPRLSVEGGPDAPDTPVVTDVIRHLAAILNASATYSACQPNFGMESEVGSIPSPELVKRLIENIKTQVALWEPRFVVELAEHIQRDASLDARPLVRLSGRIENQACHIDIQYR